MPVRDALLARVAAVEEVDRRSPARLPRRLRKDPLPTRTAMLQRLSTCRHFALGDRAGGAFRPGRPFRLDLRQRVVVKALVVRHARRAGALAQHVRYLGRAGAGKDGEQPAFFGPDIEGSIDAAKRVTAWAGDRHHFRFIVSPEHGDRIADLGSYVREVMTRAAADLKEPALEWLAVCHFDTDQPHAHVLVRGRRADGRDLVMPRAYIAYGLRAQAQAVAAERLGSLTRHEAERRVWRETQADRFTGLDRRLLDAADATGRVEDGVGGTDPWAALTRGRLRHLERLGLAAREGRTYRLAKDLEGQLRSHQLRSDVIRTLNQRRLEGARAIQELGGEPVTGRVVRSGRHDELGASVFVVVRDRAGMEHYARLAPGSAAPAAGRQVTLTRGERGVALTVERGLGRG
jgi:type IV secretory pathway VirD2 relaxase